VVDKKCGSILWKAAAELKILCQVGQERIQRRSPSRFGNRNFFKVNPQDN
jgi:hypothetical protein